MGKFDFSDVIADVQASLRKEKGREKDAEKIATAANMNPVSREAKDYVVMPEWFNIHYGVPGLPFGKIVQVAGDSDTGKTSFAITSMKQAQAQGIGILYAETEMKTSEDDLEDWGVDPTGVGLIQTNITEQVYDLSFRAIEGFFQKHPDEKLLYVIDSYGNTISMHDEDLDIVKKDQKVGGAAKTNRFGLGRLIALMDKYPIAVLLINYNYDNIGTVGKTEAGGKALKFYTMLGIRTQRTGDWEVERGGEKMRLGAYVRFVTFKNHYQKSAIDAEGNRRLLPKELSLKISAKGMEVDGDEAVKAPTEAPPKKKK